MLLQLKKLALRILDLCLGLLNDFFSFFDFSITRRVRSGIFAVIGINYHHTSFVDFGTRFYNAKNISILQGVGIGHFNRFWGFGKIRIGQFCQTALGVTMVSGTHNISSMEPASDADIIIEDLVWIGANVTVVGPCRIGKGSIIGAGSLVLGDVEPMSIYGGIPAKCLRKRKIDIDNFYGPRGKLSPAVIKTLLEC